jgi:hypothetical protein
MMPESRSGVDKIVEMLADVSVVGQRVENPNIEGPTVRPEEDDYLGVVGRPSFATIIHSADHVPDWPPRVDPRRPTQSCRHFFTGHPLVNSLERRPAEPGATRPEDDGHDGRSDD